MLLLTLFTHYRTCAVVPKEGLIFTQAKINFFYIRKFSLHSFEYKVFNMCAITSICSYWKSESVFITSDHRCLCYWQRALVSFHFSKHRISIFHGNGGWGREVWETWPFLELYLCLLDSQISQLRHPVLQSLRKIAMFSFTCSPLSD